MILTQSSGRRESTPVQVVPQRLTAGVERDVDCEFDGQVWSWRGPAPYHFVTLPTEHADAVAEVASSVNYGWGMVPVRVRIGRTAWRTSLFPKDGGYVLPLRDSVRRKETVEIDDLVHVRLTVIGAS